MLLLTLLCGLFLNGISADAPINPSYLPPAPPFQGYPPSRPNPPQLGDPSPPEEDLESIVVEAPPFGRTANLNQGVYGIPSVETATTRFYNAPSLGFAQQNSNVDTSFAQFPGSTRTFNSVHPYVHNGNQINYARSNQHAPNTQHTLTTFNNAAPYEVGSRSTPYQLFNKNIQLGTKDFYSHFGTSLNTLRTSPAIQQDVKSQYRYQHALNNNQVLSGYRNQFHSPTYVSYSQSSLNNQYLPPSRPIEHQNDEGYTYDRPSIPFSF